MWGKGHSRYETPDSVPPPLQRRSKRLNHRTVASDPGKICNDLEVSRGLTVGVLRSWGCRCPRHDVSVPINAVGWQKHAPTRPSRIDVLLAWRLILSAPCAPVASPPILNRPTGLVSQLTPRPPGTDLLCSAAHRGQTSSSHRPRLLLMQRRRSPLDLPLRHLRQWGCHLSHDR